MLKPEEAEMKLYGGIDCVDSQRLGNGKRKRQGNTKNGNRYLAWAFVEAAK